MRQRGFSLVEVMVAAVVTALGLSGLAALLLEGISSTTSAEHRMVASLLADSLAAQVSLVPDAASVFLLPAPAAAPECSAAQPCAPADFAARSLFLWHVNVTGLLPEGSAVVCRDSTPGDGAPGSQSCDGAGAMVIKVFWTDRHAADGGFQRFSLELAG